MPYILQMGNLIVYNSKTRENITKLHRLLFGRIVNRSEHGYYYYGGILENTKYCKLTDGCYYIPKEVEIQNGKEVVMKNGMKAMKGECGKCGTKVFRILGKA